MSELARVLMVVGLAFLVGACGGGAPKKPEKTPPPTEGGGPSDPVLADANADNMLKSQKQNQLLFDLDGLVDDWQKARVNGNAMAYAGIERHLARLIADNRAFLVELAGNSKNRRGRLVASRALGFSPEKEARMALVALLATDDADLLENALMGLTLHPTADLPATVIAGHLRSPEVRVQQNAALALHHAVMAGAELDPAVKDGTVARLRVLLMDRDHPVLRANVAGALGRLGTSDCENDLLNLLGDENPYPRVKAMVALQHVGTRNSLMPMVQMLRSPERNLRSIAAKVLVVLTDREGWGFDRGVLGEDAGAWTEAIEEKLRREEG